MESPLSERRALLFPFKSALPFFFPCSFDFLKTIHFLRWPKNGPVEPERGHKKRALCQVTRLLPPCGLGSFSAHFFCFSQWRLDSPLYDFTSFYVGASLFRFLLLCHGPFLYR